MELNIGAGPLTRSLATIALCLAAPSLLVSQGVVATPHNQSRIIMRASESVEVTPDRATIMVAVETREKSAAGAGALNARIQTAVLDSLKRLGIAEAVAQAAGGHIAGVIEIVVNPGNQAPEPPMVAMTMARGMEADAPTPVEAGTSKITVSVEARFRFEGKAGG